MSLLLVGVMTGLTWGQGSISLDGVNGLWGVDTLNVNQTITFNIRLTNNTGYNITGSTNGFRIYSPTGAEWVSTVGAATGAITMDMYDGGYFDNLFSDDGMGADTIGFGGFKLFKPGVPDGFDEIVATIDIGPIDPMYHKGQICLDSSFYRPIGFWKWSTTGGDVYPDWDGPHCFTVFDPDAPEENLPPVLEPVGDQVTDENVNLTFGVVASDPDATTPLMTMTSADLPGAALFTDNGDGTGTFNWTPGYPDAGEYNAVFYATDADDAELYDSEAITITVNDVNRPPVLAEIGPQGTDEGINLTFPVSATDPDGTPLTLVMTDTDLPAEASFADNGDGSGVFDWTPTYDDAGGYTALFYVSDGQYADSEMVTITVANINQAPVLASIGNKEVPAEVNLNFGVSASDPDGETPDLVVGILPPGAAFVDNGNGTGTFDWTPAVADIGFHMVRFIAIDDFDAADTEMVQINVTAPNSPPVIEPIEDFYMTECDTLSATLSAVDPDEDPISMWVDPLADNMTFTDNGDGTGLLYFTPNFVQEGTYPLTLHASDGELESSVSFNVIVENCETGFIADVIIEPDFIYAFYAFAINPMSATIFFGNITDCHVVSDVEVSSLLINGTIVPTATEIVPTMTGFDGEVLAITIPMRDFVYYYGAFMDTVVETYSVAGMFSDEVPFVTEGAVTLRGHLSGDVNLDGIVDISDITYLVAYIFGGGPVPRLLLTADMDDSGAVDISDLTGLIELVF
jgi:hypothetical protein